MIADLDSFKETEITLKYHDEKINKYFEVKKKTKIKFPTRTIAIRWKNILFLAKPKRKKQLMIAENSSVLLHCFVV